MCCYEDLSYRVALAPAVFPVINREGSEKSSIKVNTDDLMACKGGLQTNSKDDIVLKYLDEYEKVV